MSSPSRCRSDHISIEPGTTMDFGRVVGVESLADISSEEWGSLLPSLLASSTTEQTHQRGFPDSSVQKHGRSIFESEDERLPMVSRPEAMASADEAKGDDLFLNGSNSDSLFSDGEQMRSIFSSTYKQDDASMHAADGTSPYFQDSPLESSPTLPYLGNAGLIQNGISAANGNLNGLLGRVGKPFTPSQVFELVNQTLIYNYFASNVVIPANTVLAPGSTSLDPFGGFTSFSAGCFDPTTLDWGSFNVGHTENAKDQEHGRCRRTDGKKWRCSRDIVPGQKYCERHINRGRRGSRKDVEGQHGLAENTQCRSASASGGRFSTN